MSTYAEFQSWLVVEIADTFGAATLAGKIFSDIGCTVARVDGAGCASAIETDADRELFELVSRNKHSVGIDWGAAASGALDALLGAARVLVVDRDALLRLRGLLRCTDLHDRYPRLTVCACTLFGIEGPLAAWTGGEEIVQAVAGIMSITGHPGAGPTRVAGAPLTYAAAMLAVTSSLAEIERRKGGGKPRLLDVAVYDAAVAFQSASLPAYFLSGVPPEGIGNRHSMSVPWNSFRCSDGWVIVCAGNHPNWVRLCEMIGHPELVSDPRYATQAGRIAHVDEIESHISAWMRDRPVAGVEALLNANTIAGGSIMPLHDVIDHPQFRARNLADLRDDGCQAGGVFHLDRTPLDVREGAWRYGAGSRSVLVDRCGVCLAQYERWVAEGSVWATQGRTHVATA